MKKIHSATFRGKRWYMLKRKPYNADGICHHPKTVHRGMWIPQEGKTVENLDTILHEGIHACHFDLDEDSVKETARDVARLLWRLGWRKCID